MNKAQRSLWLLGAATFLATLLYYPCDYNRLGMHWLFLFAVVCVGTLLLRSDPAAPKNIAKLDPTADIHEKPAMRREHQVV